jgi:hypothetical protein
VFIRGKVLLFSDLLSVFPASAVKIPAFPDLGVHGDCGGKAHLPFNFDFLAILAILAISYGPLPNPSAVPPPMYLIHRNLRNWLRTSCEIVVTTSLQRHHQKTVASICSLRERTISEVSCT